MEPLHARDGASYDHLPLECQTKPAILWGDCWMFRNLGLMPNSLAC